MRLDRSFTSLLSLGTPRTPSGLGFLIRELQTLKGELTVMERQPADQPEEIASHKAAIAAIELTMRRHPTKPDPALLPGVRRNAKRKGGYGNLTKQLFRALREIGPRQVETIEITNTVIRLEGLVMEHAAVLAFRKSVLKHMNYLKVRRHVVLINEGQSGGRTQSIWALVKHPEFDEA